MVAFQDISSRLGRMGAAPLAALRGKNARIEFVAEGQVTAAHILEEGEYRIGARPDCDFVIPESPYPHIAVLKLGRGASHLSLVPFVEGATLDGAPLAPFTATTIANPALFAIGGTALRLTPARGAASPLASRRVAAEDAEAGPQQKPPRSTRSAAGGMLATIDPRKLLWAAGLLLAAALVSSYRDDPGFAALSPGGAGSTPREDTRITDADEALRLLRQQLASADLGDTLTVRKDGGVLIVSGLINDRQEERLRGVLSTVRRRATTEIHSQVSPTGPSMPTQIAGVALTPVAMVILTDGGRYRVGDTLPRNWKVEAITQRSVVLSRDNMRETVALGGR